MVAARASVYASAPSKVVRSEFKIYILDDTVTCIVELGRLEGISVGTAERRVGMEVGVWVGVEVGVTLGSLVGYDAGCADGVVEGTALGRLDGEEVGIRKG